MRKSWIGFGVVAGTAATIAIVPYFIDWNWFKPQLVSAVEKATGYNVEVAGDIGFSLLPSPRLSAEGLTIGGFGASKSPLVTADKLSASVAFLPLLSKRAEVKYIALERPVVRLVTYADGGNNWKNPESSSSGDGDLSIEDFRIEDGTFINEAADGGTTQIDDINVRVEIASANGPYALDGALRYGDLPVALKAGYKVGGGVDLTAELSDAATLRFAGQIGKNADGGATPIGGRLSIEAAELGALLAKFSDDGKPKTAAAYKAPLKLIATVEGTTERLLLTAIDGTVAGSDTGGELDLSFKDRMSASGRLIVARLDAADWMSEKDDDEKPFELPKDIDADVLLRVVQASYGEMKFGAVNAPLKLANAVLTLGRTSVAMPGGGAAEVSGLLDAAAGKPRFRGQFSASLPRPAATLAALDSDGYARMPPLAMRGNIALAGEVLTLSPLTGLFDGKPVSGRVIYPFDKARPVDVVLAAQSINMDRMVSKPSAKGRDETARAIRFNVRFGQLLNSGKSYGGITAMGTYANDKLTLAQALVKDALGFGVTAKGTLDRLSGDRRANLAIGLAGENVKGAITVKGPMTKLDVGGMVNYAGANVGLDGWVRIDPDTAYDLTATAKAAEAGVVLARLQDEPRASKLGPLDLKMRIAGAGDVAKISGISGKVGGMTLAGDATVNTADTVPRIAASLSAGVVPVTALLGDDGTGAAEAATGKGARWSSEPLSFDWIRGFDGRIALEADRAIYDAYVLEKPSVVLVSKGGLLTIEGLKAAIYGGDLAASGTLRAGGTQSLAIRMALSDVPVEPLLKASMASAPATGTLGFTGSFTASGGSQKALMSSLAGPVRIVASNGIIRKVDLKRLDEHLGDLRSVNSLVQFAGAALKGGETQYRTLAADLTGRGGRFTIVKITSDLDGGSAAAKGYVDIGAYYADITAMLSLGSHEDAPSIPAIIRGALPTPEVQYTLGPLQTWFGKRIALAGIKAATTGEGLDLGGLLGVRKPAAPTVNAEGKTTESVQGAVPPPTPKAAPKSVDEELGGALAEGLGKLFGKKKPATQPAPAPAPTTEEKPLEPADLGDPN